MIQEKVTIKFEPEAFQHCPDLPQVPQEGATEADWRDFTADLEFVAKQCKDRVNLGRTWQEQQRLEQLQRSLSPEQ